MIIRKPPELSLTQLNMHLLYVNKSLNISNTPNCRKSLTVRLILEEDLVPSRSLLFQF